MNTNKIMGFTALFFFLLTVMATNSIGQINGVYYMTSYPRTGGETVDTYRIRRAITAVTTAGGGKLIFGEGTYTVDDTIDLISSIIIEGVSKKSVTVAPSMIYFTATNKALFKLDSNTYDVSIRDIGLAASTKTGTTAILAENTSSNTSSLGFQFSNIIFTKFNRGIWVNSVSITNWQFDNVRLDHCAFEDINTGIELNADNTGWNMSSLDFHAVPVNGFGMKLLRSGYVSMDLIIGNGVSGIADTFIYVASHGNLSIKNSQGENFGTQLNIDGNDLTYPVVLTNNVFGKDVILKSATVVSNGNFYGANNLDAKPVVSGSSQVFSIGDRFCYDAQTSRCAVGDFDIQPDHCTTGTPPACTGGYPVYYASVLKLSSDNTGIGTPSGTYTANRSLISARTFVDDKVLLELGSSRGNYVYTLTRRSSDGWLSFDGTQADPYKGFIFNAPLTLKTVTFTNLPTSTQTTGTLVYCTNCLTGSSPCSSGGSGGALAIWTGSGQWVCK